MVEIKYLTIEDDLIIDNNANLRNIDWVQVERTLIRVGGDFMNNGFMSTDGDLQCLQFNIELNGTSPQNISGMVHFE